MVTDPLSFGCGFAALRCIAELHSARRWETPVRGTDPTLRRLQVGDTADCPSPMRFDATAPKPEAKAGKSALQQSARSALTRYPVTAYFHLDLESALCAEGRLSGFVSACLWPRLERLFNHEQNMSRVSLGFGVASIPGG